MMFICQNFLSKNSHPNMSIYPNYFLLIFFLSFFVSSAIGQQENNDEDQIIEMLKSSLDFNGNVTLDWKKEALWIKNVTGRRFNFTQWRNLNNSVRPTFPPILMSTTKKPRQIPVGPKLYNDTEVDSIWRIRMVHNLHWDLSKNFLAVSYLNLESQTMTDPEETIVENPYYPSFQRNSHLKVHLHIDVIGPHYYPNTRMSFFYGIGQPNMLIRFNQTENGAAFCEFGQLKESVLHKNQEQLNDWKLKHCLYHRKPIYENEGNLSMRKQFYAFCPIDSAEDGSAVFIWRLANGIYNPPSKTPHCIYDFHRKATETEEYHLLKYCSKAYFFNGLDYNVLDKRIQNRRKDWMLYLAEGKLKCSISGNIQNDIDLVGKGYSVKLVHYSSPMQVDPLSKKCPVFKATLVEYKDKMKEGKFIIAAVVGAAQLDGDLRKPYEKESARFWDKNTYNEKYKYMNLEDKSCYIFYQLFLRDLRTKRYHLQLEISHFCTERGMRGNLEFNVSIGPDQVPEEGIYEDKGIQIYLDKGQMIRSTGQIINARKNEKSATHGINSIKTINSNTGSGLSVESTIAASQSQYYKNIIVDAPADDSVPANGNCSFTRECGYGYHCGNKNQQRFCAKISKASEFIEIIMLGSGILCVGQLKNFIKGEPEELNFEWRRPNNFEVVVRRTDPTLHCILANNSQIRVGKGPDNRGIDCKYDSQCRVDEFCAIQNGECRKLRFLIYGEKCYLDGECVGQLCVMSNGEGWNRWGYCSNPNTFNQLVEEPNDPLI